MNVKEEYSCFLIMTLHYFFNLLLLIDCILVQSISLFLLLFWLKWGFVFYLITFPFNVFG